MIKKPDLLTISEVADRLGLSTSTITSYKARGYMPQPDTQYGRTPLWKVTTIDSWRAKARRVPVK